MASLIFLHLVSGYLKEASQRGYDLNEALKTVNGFLTTQIIPTRNVLLGKAER